MNILETSSGYVGSWVLCGKNLLSMVNIRLLDKLTVMYYMEAQKTRRAENGLEDMHLLFPSFLQNYSYFLAVSLSHLPLHSPPYQRYFFTCHGSQILLYYSSCIRPVQVTDFFPTCMHPLPRVYAQSEQRLYSRYPFRVDVATVMHQGGARRATCYTGKRRLYAHAM